MPIGCTSLVPHIANRILTRRPRRVLDLGIGFGLYGAVVRQWGDMGIMPWQTYLVGVEAWADYRNPAWDLYNLIVIDSIPGFLAKQQELFDLVLLNDVIEHFTLDEGRQVLARICELVAPGGALMVGTPAVFAEQGAAYGNEFERHRSLWHADDFISRGFQIILDGRPDDFGNQMLLAEWRREE